MAFIDWKPEYSVNVAEIDRQHQTLIGMINDLFEAMKVKQGDQVIGSLIRKLTTYTSTHFKTEERYFDQFGYAEASAHKQLHQQFVDQVTDFQAKQKAGSLTLSMEMLKFLERWLIGHIQGEDKKYSAVFNEKGLK